MSKTKDLSEVEIKIGLTAKDLISAIKKLNGEDKEFLIENLLAATSPEYLGSIKEARKNYKEGRTISHNELFGK
ncbi:hypothetical protein J7K55_00215 [Candidatus Aerophobetes bacterium]|nr:hypothetical protein [Candidatus Aerophobetes bacterium]